MLLGQRLLLISFQDDTLQAYIDEVNAFLIDGGVIQKHITPGLVARGVADLWNFGSGQGKLSEYFIQRASQLAYKDGD
ncbi:MAG: hypothetical protein HUK24_07925 [Sphaerochaetaceae bacterium]|nr:hypothetical protein [Sphaerochaetaceae bacterium]